MLAFAKKLGSEIPFYVFLLPAMYYGRWYLELRHQAELPEFLLPLLFCLVAILALLVLLGVVLGSRHRAAVAIALLMFAIISLPGFFPLLGPATIRFGLAVGTVTIVFLCMLWVLRRVRSSFQRTTIILNVVVAAMTAPDLYQLVAWEVDIRPHRPDAVVMFPAIDASGARTGPDVWDILFDRYAGNETLKSVYEFDNTPFLDELELRGFSVAGDARANYHMTPLSLLSTFSLGYLDDLQEHFGLRSDDWIPIYRSLRNNRVIRFFRGQGYRLYQIGSWWEPTRSNPNVDVNVVFRSLPEFARLMLQQSLLGPAVSVLGGKVGDGRSDQCGRVSFQFSHLREIAASPEPKYVFAHLLLPHPPFVLRADGSCKSIDEVVSATRVKNYIDQLKVANREALVLVDAILHGPRPAIIILHADEGPWPARFAVNESYGAQDRYTPLQLDFTPAELQEKMRILYAVRSPDTGRIQLGKRETPVNLYRKVFNAYFGLHLPYLPERSFVAEFATDNYHYHDVTAELP